MASPSPLLMILSQDKVQAGSNQETSKSELPPKLPRGRKPNKSNKQSPLKKKPSRRGMGIDRLERLRQHEMLPEVEGFTHHLQFQTSLPLMPLAAASPYVVGSDWNRLSTSFMPPKVISTIGNGAFGNESTLKDHNWVEGLLDTSSSKELSSIPKVMNQCDAYSSKNKCTTNNSMKEVVPSLINCHLLSTELNSHAHCVGLDIKPIYHKDSELVGITRQASLSVLKEYEFLPPGKGLKEYEFFPGTNSARGYTRSASEQPNIHYYTEGASASSYFIPSDYSHYNAASNATNNTIDLSLKL